MTFETKQPQRFLEIQKTTSVKNSSFSKDEQKCSF